MLVRGDEEDISCRWLLGSSVFTVATVLFLGVIDPLARVSVPSTTIADDVGSTHDVFPLLGSMKYSRPDFESVKAYQVIVVVLVLDDEFISI